MTIRHHPEGEVLFGYAHGALVEALALAVAVHCDACAACRATVGLGEAVAGRLLDQTEPAAMAAGAWDAMLRRLDAPPPAIGTAPEGDPALPPALRHRSIGQRREVAPGLWMRLILSDPSNDTRIFILGASAGTALPRHGHDGIEMTQVLSGAFTDGDALFGPGDFLHLEGAGEHQPIVTAGGECVCIIGSIGAPLGETGVLVRAFT